MWKVPLDINILYERTLLSNNSADELEGLSSSKITKAGRVLHERRVSSF